MLSLTLVTTELPIASVVFSAGVTLCKVNGWMRGRLVHNLLQFIAVFPSLDFLAAGKQLLTDG